MPNDKSKLSQEELLDEQVTTNANDSNDDSEVSIVDEKNPKEKKASNIIKKLELKIKDFKHKISDYKYENKILIKKAENNAKEINSLKMEIKKINSEYVDNANSFAKKAQDKVDEFKTKEHAKTAHKVNEIKKYGFQKTGEELIDILNQLNQVVNFKSDNAAVNAYVTGFAMITKNFTHVLTNAGIHKIDVKVGEIFNSSKHSPFEIITTTEIKENDHIAQIIHDGYSLHDRVIKPVIVKVYKYKKQN